MKLAETKSTHISMGFSSKDHPIWGILKVLVGIFALTIVVKMNASHFDMGEVRTIVYAGLINFLLEAFNVKRKNK